MAIGGTRYTGQEWLKIAGRRFIALSDCRDTARLLKGRIDAKDANMDLELISAHLATIIAVAERCMNPEHALALENFVNHDGPKPAWIK